MRVPCTSRMAVRQVHQCSRSVHHVFHVSMALRNSDQDHNCFGAVLHPITLADLSCAFLAGAGIRCPSVSHRIATAGCPSLLPLSYPGTPSLNFLGVPRGFGRLHAVWGCGCLANMIWSEITYAAAFPSRVAPRHTKSDSLVCRVGLAASTRH